MTKDFSGFLTRLAAYFEAGDLDRLAAHCVMPLPVYFGDQLMVLGSQDVAAEALGLIRKMVTARDMARVEAVIEAVELPVGRYQRLFVVWTYTDTAGRLIGRSRVRYVLEPQAADIDPRVHLVHYVSTDFTDLAEQMPFSAPGETI